MAFEKQVGLPVGQVLTVTAVGVDASLYRVAESDGQPSAPVAVVVGTPVSVGPFATERHYAISSDNGAATYAYTTPDLATSADNALKLSKAADDTLAEGVDIALGTTTGTKIGTATAQKLAFHNSTPVIQRAGAAQAAVVTTAAGLASYGYTEEQANAIVALVNELRAALVEKGLIKGAA